MRDRLIEAVRKQWVKTGARFTGETEEEVEAQFQTLDDESKARFTELIEDLLVAIEAEDCKIVSRSLDPAMATAGYKVISLRDFDPGSRHDLEDVWWSFYSSAPSVAAS